MKETHEIRYSVCCSNCSKKLFEAYPGSRITIVCPKCKALAEAVVNDSGVTVGYKPTTNKND